MCARTTPTFRRALTLVELVAAMAVMSIITAAVASTLMIAARAVNSSDTPGAQTPQAREIADEIVADLADALEFTERTDTSVTFTVPDRDTDGQPETIRYAWDAASNGVLTREYNGGSAVTVADGVASFDLTYLTRTVTPPPQACCWMDGTCSEEVPDDCSSNGGTPKGRKTECTNVQCVGACCIEGNCVDTTEAACLLKSGGVYQGDGTACADVVCEGGTKVLFVVASKNNLTDQEEATQSLLESFGFHVELIADESAASDYTAAFAEFDVAYVSANVNGAQLSTKLTSAPIGVVNASASAIDELGLSSGTVSSVSTSTGKVVDNTHYITSTLATGAVTISTSTQPYGDVLTGIASGAKKLATVSESGFALFAVELGATLSDGNPAAGRRVQLPFSQTSLDVDALSEDGKTIMRRAIEWGAVDVKQILDRFTSTSYSGSDGTVAWSNDWQEIGESNGTSSDPVRVSVHSYCASGSCLRFGSQNNAVVDGCGASREADISGAAWAVLSFDYRRLRTSNTVDVILAISADGGGSWTNLATYTLDTIDASENAASFDITSYISDQTQIRLLGSGLDVFRGFIFIDNVQILFGGTAGGSVSEVGEVCGDGICDAGETPCDCSADCGEPTEYEQPGVDCNDGIDNDCDGQVDCADINCTSDPACAACGDLACEGSEDACNCPTDCGEPPAVEAGDDICADGKDNDCDGNADCADPDCASYTPCVGSCSCNGTYADDFESVTFGGSVGDIAWPGDWIEVGESDGPTAGDILIASVDSSYRIRLRDNDNGGEGVARDVPLCATGTAVLTFVYQRDGLDDASDYVTVQVSANGDSGPWTEIGRLAGPARDGDFLTFAHDISAYAGPDTRILFRTSPDMGNNDEVWIDDVAVVCSP